MANSNKKRGQRCTHNNKRTKRCDLSNRRPHQKQQPHRCNSASTLSPKWSRWDEQKTPTPSNDPIDKWRGQNPSYDSAVLYQKSQYHKKKMRHQHTNPNDSYHRRFDSTLGYPGEGPDVDTPCECLKSNCMISGHYHSVRKLTGATRRLREKSGSKPKPRSPPTFALCEIESQRECPNSSGHAHTKRQNVFTSESLALFNRFADLGNLPLEEQVGTTTPPAPWVGPNDSKAFIDKWSMDAFLAPSERPKTASRVRVPMMAVKTLVEQPMANTQLLVVQPTQEDDEPPSLFNDKLSDPEQGVSVSTLNEEIVDNSVSWKCTKAACIFHQKDKNTFVVAGSSSGKSRLCGNSFVDCDKIFEFGHHGPANVVIGRDTPDPINTKILVDQMSLPPFGRCFMYAVDLIPPTCYIQVDKEQVKFNLASRASKNEPGPTDFDEVWTGQHLPNHKQAMLAKIPVVNGMPICGSDGCQYEISADSATTSTDMSVHEVELFTTGPAKIKLTLRERFFKLLVKLPFGRQEGVIVVNDQSKVDLIEVSTRNMTTQDSYFFKMGPYRSGPLYTTSGNVRIDHLSKVYNHTYTGSVYTELVRLMLENQKLYQRLAIRSDGTVAKSLVSAIVYGVTQLKGYLDWARDAIVLENSLVHVCNQVYRRGQIVNQSLPISSAPDFRFSGHRRKSLASGPYLRSGQSIALRGL